MKKTPIVVGIVVVLLVLGGWWFWSLGKVSAVEDAPTFSLTMQSPSVEVKAANASNWVALTDQGMSVHAGDEIKTGPNGKAEIHWGERGVTRLENNTDLIVESMPDEEHYMTNASIQLRLSSGRVWTRVLKLLDMNSQVTVKTDDVVATVRGTAFGVVAGADGSDVLVSESSVAVTPTGKDKRVISQNEAGTFQKKGIMGRRTITDTDIWVNDQKKADEKYDDLLREKMKKRLKKFEASNTRGLAERVHSRLAVGDDQTRLQEFMTHRALLQSRQSGHALPAREILQRLPPKARERVLANVEAMLFTNPDAPETWKKQMEAMRGQVIEIEGGRPQYIEELPALEELTRDLMSTSTLPMVTGTRPVPTSTKPVFIQPLKVDLAPSPLTQPLQVTPPPPAPSPAPTLTLIATPSAGTVDSPVQLTVYENINGEKINVTANTRFSTTGGSLTGSSFVSSETGSFAITATYVDQTSQKTLTTTLNINFGPPIEAGPAAATTFGVQ